MSESPFYDIGSLFPGEVSVASVPPEKPIGETLELMLEKRYSQLPVVKNGEVLGVFSLWSLAHHLTYSPGLKIQAVLSDVPVEDVMEQIPSVTVRDSLHSVLDLLARHECLLVGSPHGLQAVATPADVLRYFYQVARPYILLREIEIGLRQLIDICVSGEHLQVCIENALKGVYEERKKPLPTRLSDLSFEEYRSIITCKANWERFAGTLGRNRDLVSAKLERLRKIRNDVFHFRTDISVRDYQELAMDREWLLMKLRRSRPSGPEDLHAR